MDHDHHDHHDHGDSGHAHGHAMTFHASAFAEILFNGWVTTNALEMFGSCVAIFLAGVLYEGLKYFREILHSRVPPPRDSRVNITKSECGTTGSCTGPAAPKYSMFSAEHAVQTALHLVQSTFSYMLMLVFMTYNVWPCLALVLGLAVGYFLFGGRRASLLDSNEHCQ